jgi:erythromycin esterase-like protein
MTSTVETLRSAARPLEGGPRDFDDLLAAIGDARFVLLGEASHGTHEFYRLRAEITRRLIAEKGFRAVAAEADWPSADRVNRFVRGDPGIEDAEEALEDFKRLPTWMWRNADVLDFVGWLRERNGELPGLERAGFYGLDLYSLHESIEAVLSYLDRVDPEAAKRARGRYSCFDDFGGDPQAYGYAAAAGTKESCGDAVVEQLVELRRRALDESLKQDQRGRAEFFSAERNASLVQNAEEYYRAMFRGRASSWNLRDRHMFETLEALSAFLEEDGSLSKIVVWAHNSHLGDARATQMGQSGELNVGQLVRERHGNSAQLPAQFDALIHCDVSRAVEPLERFAPIPAEELPETYPWGV